MNFVEFSKLKNISKGAAIAAIFFTAILAPAGTGGTDGGGGSAVQCQVKPEVTPVMVGGKLTFTISYDQKLASEVTLSHDRKFELTDLWEAETGYGPFQNHKLPMMYDDATPVKQQIAGALDRLTKVNPQFGALIARYLGIVESHVIPVPPNSYVLPPQDTDIRYMRIGCTTVGLGAYSDRDNNLVIDPQVWQTLSKIDKAAFLMHEAIYKALRDTQNAQDSWQTRRIVGLLFSSQPFTWDDVTK